MNWKFWKNWFRSAEENTAGVTECSQEEAQTAPDDEQYVEAILQDTHPVIYISETLLERTRLILASFNEKRRPEGICYWFGLEMDEISVITTLVVPNADTNWGCIRTSPQANAEALSAIIGTPLVLVGQAHSHPGTMVRHSRTDDMETFAGFDGALSVVVPNFARDPVELKECGIHRHRNGRYEYIQTDEISEHIRVLPGEADFRVATQ